MDVTNINLGDDFVEAIERKVGDCGVFIELIGKQWATITDSAGRRRLDHPQDWVRLEVASALRRSITVIPVLVHGATMPDASTLPEDVAPLTRHNALEITESDFDHDVERLIDRLNKIFGIDNRPQPLLPRTRKSHFGCLALSIAAGLIALVVIGLIAMILVLPTNPTNPANPGGAQPQNPEAARDNVATPHVQQIHMAKDNNGSPGEWTTSFEPQDRPIYCVVELNRAQEGTSVRFMWKAVDVAGSENQYLNERDYTTSDIHAVQVFNQPYDWPTGTYRVEVYINGTLDKTIDYTIE
jgi:hypothetical protein